MRRPRPGATSSAATPRTGPFRPPQGSRRTRFRLRPCAAVIQLVERSEFFLAEALAQKIAETVLSDPRVKEVEVKVDKPSALRGARSVGVEIVRRRA